MHSKIYRAKLINLHSSRKTEQKEESERSSFSIHAYYGMLQHVFQRNKHLLRELKLSGIQIQKRLVSKEESENQKEFASGNVRKKNISQRKNKSSENKIRNVSTSMTDKKLENNVQTVINPEKSLNCFIPIGLALQNKKKSRESPKRYDYPSQRAGKIIFKSKGVVEFSSQRHTERSLLIVKKKTTISRAKCSFMKVKSEGCEKTHHTSIRSTEKSAQENSSISIKNLPFTPQKVSPW